MQRRLEKLRQKPEEHRRKVAFISTSAIMLAIVGVWLVTLPTRFPELAPSNQDQAAAVLANTNQTPVESLQNSLASGYNAFAQVTSSNTVAATTSDTVSNGVIISNPNQDPTQLQVVQ